MLKNLDFKKKIRSFLSESLSLGCKNDEFYLRALTHSSFLQNKNTDPSLQDNESLEFLGDSLIGWIVAKKLFEINKTPSDMTKLKNQIIQSGSLEFAAKEIKLNEMLRTGTSLKNVLPCSVLENAFEAFVAAIYLDNDFDTAEKFINDTLWLHFKENKLDFAIDYKTILQEFSYKVFKKRVVYKHKLMKSTSEYFITCTIGTLFETTTTDTNLKNGEKRCAKQILDEQFGEYPYSQK